MLHQLGEFSPPLAPTHTLGVFPASRNVSLVSFFHWRPADKEHVQSKPAVTMYIRIQVDIAIAGTEKGMDEGETEHGVGKPAQAL